MNQNEFVQVVRAEYEDAIASHGQLKVVFFVVEVCNKHASGNEFALCAAKEMVKQTLGRLVRDDKPHEKAEQQFLPGLLYVQPRYLITRNGDQMIVATEKMTPLEKRDRAAMMKKMANGLSKHADELIYLAEQEEANEPSPPAVSPS